MSLVIGSNSFVTLAEANSYFAEKYGASVWASLTSANKEQLLISAYRWITRSSEVSVPPTATATNVKYAQIELAWYIYCYNEEHNKRSALYSQGVRSFNISKFSETLSQGGLPDIVKDLLKDSLNTGHKFPLLTRTND